MGEIDFDWLRERKKALGLTDEQIGAAIGKERSVANRLVNGELPFDVKYLDGLATVFRVPKTVILYRYGVLDEDPEPASLAETKSPFISAVQLPDFPPTRRASAGDGIGELISLDLSLSMGPGTLIEDFVEAESVKIDLGFIRRITRTPLDRLRLIRGIGDSMEPTLRSSDMILVDINERALSRISGIYWIDYLGAHGIKRLRPAGPGRITIISDNPVEGEREVDAADLRIEGRAIWFARDL